MSLRSEGMLEGEVGLEAVLITLSGAQAIRDSRDPTRCIEGAIHQVVVVILQSPVVDRLGGDLVALRGLVRGTAGEGVRGRHLYTLPRLVEGSHRRLRA